MTGGPSESNKRIARNTLYLYLRQIVILLIGLYTVRIVLGTLGEDDYGIYNVVAGTVTMFGFLTGALAVSSQRFFSFYLGNGDLGKLNKIFGATITIYAVLVGIIVILAETVGLWIINNKLTIPADRMVAANWIFQFSILSFVQSMMTVPYMASIIAHEKMGIYARISILEASLKLLIVYLLVILPYDKLITYGFLLFVVTAINTAVYRAYCVRHFVECKFRLHWDKVTIREIAGFSVWNLCGNFASVVKNQGIAILLNMFFGPAVNAAQQIATQVKTAGAIFAQNFSMAVQPQITKTYAASEYDRMFRLAFRSAKINFFLMLVVVLPVIFHIKFILDLWLTVVPEYTVSFCKLLLIETLIETSSLPLATINQATGKIKFYQSLIGIIGVLNLPVSYLALRYGASPDTVFVIGIILQCFIVLVRIFFLWRVDRSSVWRCFKDIVFPCLAVACVAYFLCVLVNRPADGFAMTAMILLAQVSIAGGVSYLIGLRKDEKQYVISMIKKGLDKLIIYRHK